MAAELSLQSNFTFLTGASHPEEHVERAVLLGLPALAIADDNSVAGIVRAHGHAREIARMVAERRAWEAANTPIGPPRPAHLPPPPSYPIHAVPRVIPAARLVFTDAPPITVLPATRRGWASLCRLLSLGRLRAEKGNCILRLSDLEDHAEDLHLLLWPQAAAWQRGAGAAWP
ncbi:error-prone DNA polymerase, partial [Cribrihabitans sp. XS_ASV171]